MTTSEIQAIKLTQYSHGAGCGCKISPKVLDSILQTNQIQATDARLLVGNASRDDAAVYDLGDGTAIVSTTDFFMPIVDDGFDFGRIASVNAISDVYAMGGTPMMAIAILGWPVDKLPPEAAQRVLEGSRDACRDAGIILAGGHSIDSPEPIFGLAVTGRVQIDHLKQNTGAKPGCKLFLTKPLGVGILTTSQKKSLLQPEHSHIARDLMVQLNKAGETFGRQTYVRAMTDVTGFGLLGHLSEMCEGSEVSARIVFNKVPRLSVLDYYLERKCVPGGTHRNWDSYGHKVGPISEQQRLILCDPQTSGGLLVAVDAEAETDFVALAAELGLSLETFGELIPQSDTLITVV